MEKEQLNAFLLNSLDELKGASRQIPTGSKPVSGEELFEFAQIVYQVLDDFRKAIIE